jgi:hypothetical protein
VKWLAKLQIKQPTFGSQLSFLSEFLEIARAVTLGASRVPQLPQHPPLSFDVF